MNTAPQTRQSARDTEVAALRVPPHSTEAEQSVLGGLLIASEAWDRVGDLVVAADFYRFEHREIFEAIAALLNACKPADVVTVFEHLQRAGKAEAVGGLAYLNALAQSVPSAANIRRYAEIVRDRAVTRELIVATRNAEAVAWGDQPMAAKLDRIATEFLALERRQITSRPRSIGEIAARRIDHYGDLEAGRVPTGWATGIPTLDDMLTGGLKAGSLYIVAARPSVGKSSFSQAVAMQMAATGHPTLFLSQEMAEVELTDRAVASAGRISYTALLAGRMQDNEGWSRAADALEHLGRLPLFIDDQPALRLGDIRAKARQVKGLKVLVLDYLQLCSSDLTRENRNAQVEEISRGLKALAKQLGIAVIALSQLNRDVEKRPGRRPCLADLRDSGAIEQDADTVIFLWPVRELPGGRKLIGCGIDKNRNGPCGQFPLDFNGDLQRWAESTEPIEKPQQAGQGRGTFE